MPKPIIKSIGPSKCYCLEKKSDTAAIFFHGVPFNASFWLPVLEESELPYSCYAIDLKGFGFSADDSRLSDFGLLDQLSWLESIVQNIPAEKFVFIMHGWSSVPATMLAQKLGNKISGLVYFEAQVRAVRSPDMLSLPMQVVAEQLLSQENLEEWVLKDNGYPELIMPLATTGCLQTIKQQFAKQFESIVCRKAILQYLKELPLGYKQSDIVKLIDMNAVYLERSNFAKCLMYTMPGLMTTMETVSWVKNNVKHVSILDLGHAMHCAPITMTKHFTSELSAWLRSSI